MLLERCDALSRVLENVLRGDPHGRVDVTPGKAPCPCFELQRLARIGRYATVLRRPYLALSSDMESLWHPYGPAHRRSSSGIPPHQSHNSSAVGAHPRGIGAGRTIGCPGDTARQPARMPMVNVSARAMVYRYTWRWRLEPSQLRLGRSGRGPGPRGRPCRRAPANTAPA